jgi:hypothetical protein
MVYVIKLVCIYPNLRRNCPKQLEKISKMMTLRDPQLGDVVCISSMESSCRFGALLTGSHQAHNTLQHYLFESQQAIFNACYLPIANHELYFQFESKFLSLNECHLCSFSFVSFARMTNDVRGER